MTSGPDWTIEFYVDDRGRSPVREFLATLDDKTAIAFRNSMERLRTHNVLAREPLVRHLVGDLWELRESSAGNIYRGIYFFTGRRIVFLHAFQKRTQRTPRGDLEMAQRRQASFLRRERL